VVKINSFVIHSTVAVKRSYCGHWEAGKASLEKGMLKTSLERPSHGLGWQLVNEYGGMFPPQHSACRALQAIKTCFSSFWAALASIAHADSAGINHPHRKLRMIKQGSINTNAINSNDKFRINHEPL